MDLRIYLFQLTLGVQAALLTTQGEDLQVEFLGIGKPTIKITAKHGCKNITDDSMQFSTIGCSNTRSPPGAPKTGMCTPDGVKMCLSLDLQNDECFTVKGKMNDRVMNSTKIPLDGISFFNKKAIHSSPWKHQGDTSTMELRKIPGVSFYDLYLESSSKDDNCQPATLLGEVNQNVVTFTANWSQELVSDCSYTSVFYPRDDCGRVDYYKLDLLSWKPKREEEMNPMPTNIYVVGGILCVMVLVGLTVVLVLVLTRLRRKQRQQHPSPVSSVRLMEKKSLLIRPRPTILLVYSPCLHQHMAALSIQLKNLTGLQIEDLYDVGDCDKVNDPTVWLTRRLMDTNTRFVLAVSTTSTSFPQNNGSENNCKEGGVFHYLLDHFIQHLQSSSLAHDYMRLHHVRLEQQGDIHLRDVTPGRLYLLPTHINQLAINLVLATPIPSTDRSSAFFEKIEP